MNLFRQQAVRANRRALGFSVVELIVVVAILAILLGLLFPALTGANPSINLLRCVQLRKKLGEAGLLYLAERGDDRTQLRLSDSAWRDALAPYGAEDKHWWCPGWPKEELGDREEGAFCSDFMYAGLTPYDSQHSGERGSLYMFVERISHHHELYVVVMGDGRATFQDFFK